MRGPDRTSAAYAVSGVLATLAGLAAGHLAAVLTTPSASPVLAVGSTVIDLTPTPVKEYAVRELGTADKPLLIGTVVAITLSLAALAGSLTRRSPVLGMGVLLGLVALAGVAALLRPAATAVDLLPALVSAVVAALALLALTRWLGTPPQGERATADDLDDIRADRPSRRGFLLAATAVSAFAVGAAATGRWVSRTRARIGDLVLPRAADPALPLPEGLDVAHPGISPLRTSNAQFYRVDTALSTPLVDVDGWQLTIDGDVRSPFSLDFDEPAGLPLVERDITLTCVSNEVGGEYVGAARWLGVPVRTLLERAGVGDRADQVLSTDVDGFTISTPLEALTDGRDALVAIGMNGEPLPRDHGFPARLVTPGLYGFVGATKWLSRLTLTTYDDDRAYWTQRDWATDAPIKVSSRIDTPAPLARVTPGRTAVGGVAWAQHRGIERVELRIDGGPWQETRLGPDIGIDYWRQWWLPWQATPGRHQLAVRATTADGEVQTAARAAPFPAGSSGIQEVVVTVAE